MLKGSGANIEPWGTPKSISANALWEEFISVICFRPFKYELMKYKEFLSTS